MRLRFLVLLLPGCFASSDDTAVPPDAMENLRVCESKPTRYPDMFPATVRDDGGTCCGAGARLVLRVCTQLGPGDGCVSYEDRCVAMCEPESTCKVGVRARPLNLWATAPDGYCVPCADDAIGARYSRGRTQ